MRHIQEKCFEENDEVKILTFNGHIKLRQRVMELEINYGAAQDEIEKRDEAIKEMAEQIEQ